MSYLVFWACRLAEAACNAALRLAVGLFGGSLRSVLRTAFGAPTIPHAAMLAFLFVTTSLFGQNVPKYDFNWIFGIYGTNPSPYYGNTRFNFHTNFPTITTFDAGMRFRYNNIAMSNADGELQFYFNGSTVWNKNYEVILDSIDEGQAAINPTIPNACIQGCIVLPYPEHDSLYMLIYCKMALTYDDTFGNWGYSSGLRYSLINMNGNNGLGAVAAKDVHLLDNDTLNYGKINAVCHANGRDWWIIVPCAEYGYKLFLLSPEGIIYQGFQPDFDFPNGIGTMSFSPDGSKCAVWSILVFGQLPDTLVMYDFDRCTGSMSNRQEIIKPLNNHYGYYGLVYSPDSRYLYWNRIDTLFQYDTHAADIYSTELPVAYRYLEDSLEAYHIGFPFNGPDGKTYYSTSMASSYFIHILPFPNRYGENLKFCYNGLQLEKVYWQTTTHYPNYRLGPIDGSGCDTLGINNEARANFRYDWETPNGGLVTFTDLSAYEPATWAWDFDDGSTSQDTSPVHLFAAAGVYQVCLTVSNQYGSDTFCREVVIDSVTAATQPPVYQAVMIEPNPSIGQAKVSWPQPVSGALTVTDISGKQVYMTNLQRVMSHVLDVSAWAAGVYVVRVLGAEGSYEAKLVVVR